jgi:hypothetical protein
MIIILCTSRGFIVKPHFHRLHESLNLNEDIIFEAYAGASLEKLAKIAMDTVKKQPLDSRNNISVYFLAGLPDLTTKLKNYPKKEEVVFTETSDEAVSRLTRQIYSVHNSITSLGANPCFCPIVPTNLTIYNNPLLKKTQNQSP